jgi:hypothetical protein
MPTGKNKRENQRRRSLSLLKDIAEFRNTQEIDSSKDRDLGIINLT